MEERYRVTIYVAAPGTPMASGGTSMAGHMYYTIGDGHQTLSFGFAPKTHGASSGPGEVFNSDLSDYKNPHYARTMEISKEQFEKLKEFGSRPEAHGFNTEYAGLTNSCIDFTWGALNHAGLHRTNVFSQNDKGFEGSLKPLDNIKHIHSIKAPFPGSELNIEHKNDMPVRSWKQLLISDEQQPGENHLNLDSVRTGLAGTDIGHARQEPGALQPGGADHALYQQIREGVASLDAQQRRTPDVYTERMNASLLVLAKDNGMASVDQVVLSSETWHQPAGHTVFLVKGELSDPSFKLASMTTDQAVSTTVEESMQRYQQMGQEGHQQNAARQPEQQSQMARA